MPTLAINKTTTWEKNKYASLEFSYPGPAGSGTVSVKQDGIARSLAVPGTTALEKSKDGSLTNNTDKTIDYTLS
jgi:hypothetical protein